MKLDSPEALEARLREIGPGATTTSTLSTP